MEMWESRKKPRDSHIPTAIIGIQTNEHDINLRGPKKCLDNGVHLTPTRRDIKARGGAIRQHVGGLQLKCPLNRGFCLDKSSC